MDLRMQYVGNNLIKLENVFMVEQEVVVDEDFVTSL